MRAVDLFGGAGGWDEACKALGFNPLGIEIDDAACTTREAAGLRTLQADISQLDPLDFAPCELLIGSPPCPSFSSAGKGDGIADLPLVYEAATAAARGKPVPPLPWRDERSALVVEPLRWATLLEPRFLAWEQVPPVLPFWEHCAELLLTKGWNVWTGIMEAERYGVPQTRERAILMADRDAPVQPPRPTHQRYVKGEPQRHEVTLEGEVLPWVSMAEALGWGMTERPPQFTVCGGYSDGGVETYGSGAVRRAIEAERDRGAFKFRNGNQENAAVRDAEEPAPTIHFGKALNQVEWIRERPAPTLVTTRRSKDGILVGRQLPEGEGENVGGHNWKHDNNIAACGCLLDVVDADGFCACCHAHLDDADGIYAQQGDGTTTVNGDPRISKPGRHDPEESGSQQKDAIRISLEEAAILQSFPPDYPFQGSKSQRFLQVGNAVPPLLAHAILSALVGAHLQAESPQPQETAVVGSDERSTVD